MFEFSVSKCSVKFRDFIPCPVAAGLRTFGGGVLMPVAYFWSLVACGQCWPTSMIVAWCSRCYKCAGWPTLVAKLRAKALNLAKAPNCVCDSATMRRGRAGDAVSRSNLLPRSTKHDFSIIGSSFIESVLRFDYFTWFFYIWSSNLTRNTLCK